MIENRFADLVQREWLDAGHPFSLRHGHVALVPEKDRSPMFLLFLDAVWQITQQFPMSFEFTEQFLHILLSHSYSSEYGMLPLSLFSLNERFLNCSSPPPPLSLSLSLSLSVMCTGTFLYDTPQERLKYRDKTHSLWSYLSQPEIVKFLTNPLYERNNNILLMSVSHLTVVSRTKCATCFVLSLDKRNS